MKKCISCGVSIGGRAKVCPLCHGPLQGEASEPLWPVHKQLKRRATIYKLQMFLVFCIAILFLLYDFILRDPDSLSVHYSIPVAVWAVAFELWLKNAIHCFSSPAKLLNYSGLLVMLLLTFTGWYLGFLRLCLTQIIPLIVLVLLLFNFAASLLDPYNRALPYLLCNILMGFIPYLLQFLLKGRGYATYAWTACMIVSIITFLGILIFNGKKTRDEVLKRVHM